MVSAMKFLRRWRALLQLESPDKNVRDQAVKSLLALADITTVPRLGNLLTHKQPETRRAALKILGYIGVPQAFDAIAYALNDADN